MRAYTRKQLRIEISTYKERKYGDPIPAEL